MLAEIMLIRRLTGNIFAQYSAELAISLRHDPTVVPLTISTASTKLVYPSAINNN
jgi:hypothetical protein